MPSYYVNNYDEKMIEIHFKLISQKSKGKNPPFCTERKAALVLAHIQRYH